MEEERKSNAFGIIAPLQERTTFRAVWFNFVNET